MTPLDKLAKWKESIPAGVSDVAFSVTMENLAPELLAVVRACQEGIGHETPSLALERGVQGTFWIPDATELHRIPDGIRPATHRIRALGNAVVPQCAREAFKRLSGLSETRPA